MNPNTFAMVSLAATNLSETFDRKPILDWQLDMRLSPDWTIIVGWQMISHWQQKAVINSVKNLDSALEIILQSIYLVGSKKNHWLL